MERVAILIDGANIGYSCRRDGVIVDYGSFLKWAVKGGLRKPVTGEPMRGLSHNRQIVAARVYLGPNGKDSGGRDNFIKLMEGLGFEIVIAEEESEIGKSSVDRDIMLDALELGFNGHIDRIILLSGDGGFTRPVLMLKAHGVPVEVCSFPDDTSVALQEAAAFYWNLLDIPGATRAR